jgi:hypothetical protein
MMVPTYILVRFRGIQMSDENWMKKYENLR